MKKQLFLGYYAFGTYFRFLLDIQITTPAQMCASAISDCKRLIGEIGMPVSAVAIERMNALETELKGLPPEEGIGPVLQKQLRDDAQVVEATVRAELTGRIGYVLTEKVVSIQKLSENVPALFSAGIFDKLPALAQFDLREAGACIAFERPTAAAFHLMRAIELLVRELYVTLIKQKRIKSRMWGPLIADLMTRPKAAKYLPLLHHLNHIRENFRNPTQHPDKTYDIYEVQDLWSLSVDVVNRVGKILAAERKAPKSQP